MIAVTEAHAAIAAAIPRPGIERLVLGELSGRVLAEEVLAPFPQPRFDNSAMDGYAVRSADLVGATRHRPVTLEVVGVASAGAPLATTVDRGQCAQVMTGAMLPAGADAVVMVEQTAGFVEDRVEFVTSVGPGEHIRRCGEEIVQGTRLLCPGMRIGPAELGSAATLGRARLAVFRQPAVAIFGTGDELREPGQELAPGEIYNSNLYLLADLARRLGARVELASIVPDDRDALRRVIDGALQRCDLVVSSGGVSMGRFDLVGEVIDALQLERRFWKVAQKPGLPLLFASAGAKLLFGLPGNPVSSLTCFLEYVGPTIRRWQGEAPPPKLQAVLDGPFPREPHKHRFLFGRLAVTQTQLRATPTGKLGSHMLTGALGANALLEAPAGDGPLPAGSTILAQVLPWAHLSRGD
jgi:molybdopterin molybdotransferase